MTSAPETRYSQYIKEVSSDIVSLLQSMGCQPILFIGSGLSKRYFSGPNWDQLLHTLAENCPLIDRNYTYYKQSLKSPLLVGEEFSKKYHEWAWSTGKKYFPAQLFDSSVKSDAYIKHKISEYLKSITPSNINNIKPAILLREVQLLAKIRPHAIITTNYDQFLEAAFPEYVPIIGQKIIRESHVSLGEIYKIHGCVSEANTLVFTQTDYDEFTKKKKYLSAKLLTYFSEHPLFFVGYSASDPNIKAILSDIDEVLAENGGIIPNVYIVNWKDLIPKHEIPSREKLIEIEEGRSIRIKSVDTEDFSWLFEVLGSQHNLSNVSPKTLRALLARSYELVRHDIPKKSFHADFEMLEHAVADSENFAKLFGIATVSNPSTISAKYPYILTDIGRKLGGKTWHTANKLMEIVEASKGVDIKASDNRYHYAVKYGATNIVHKYSDDLIDLLKKVKGNEEYEVDLG